MQINSNDAIPVDHLNRDDYIYFNYNYSSLCILFAPMPVSEESIKASVRCVVCSSEAGVSDSIGHLCTATEATQWRDTTEGIQWRDTTEGLPFHHGMSTAPTSSD